MAILKKMEVAVINITTHPHTPKKYVQLFRDAFKLKYPVGYRGVESFILNKPISIVKKKPLKGLSGHFHKFTEIDTHGDWLNLLKLEAVTSEDGEPVINIPEEMKPNLKTAPFVFLPRGHRLFFPSRDGKVTFSPQLIAKSLMNLFSHEQIRESYGDVTVTVETEKETINHILKIPALTKLFVDVTLPNPDDFSGDEKHALERMQKQHARKIQIALTGAKAEGIKPDADTKGFMKLSTSNGYVKAEGYDAESKKVEKSTSDHPVVFDDYYPAEKSSLSRVKAIAKKHLQRFTRRNEA
ncbi:DUF4747 family protein [Pseudodesulfovibrio sp. JC047]|uniref:DUF4747 family protein n=1 Tax=Pseudodesulfovibrio sp. JC047 TaxID=2683199 RepID=UPI0013D57FC8|nr:DUF4747 family protein [Pseudodesulfovibrio sp. JC047]NDV20862.1 DUF4747 family protein [Pseudodesulfovibrio sp. JC047]